MTARTVPQPAVPPVRADPPVVELRAIGVSYRGQAPAALPGPAGPPDGPRHGTGTAARAAGLLGGRLSGARRRPARHRQCDLPPAALSGIDLTVRAGELVTLTGPARSGTSTLLHVIGLLLRPTAGSYLLNGVDTGRLGDRDRSALRGQEIGLMFQPPRLLPGRSALDNVALPLLYAAAPGSTRSRLAYDCLERVGLASAAHRMAASLSAGERQRVAIARALVTMPSLLICDDPTAALDEEQSAQVIGLLTALRSAGRTILMATRDQLAAAYSSRSVTIGGQRGQETGQSR